MRSSTLTGAVFTRDGQWIAYATSEERGTQTYVQPFPATGARHLLVRGERGGPHHPIWSPDGKELFYVPAPGVFESVTVTTRPIFAFGNAVSLPRPFQGGPPAMHRTYDMMPDGRFLGIVAPGQASAENPSDEIYVVLNWFEELKKRVPGR